MEISSGHSYQPDFQKILLNSVSRFNFLIHNFAPPTSDGFLVNLAAPEKKIRDKSTAFILDRIRLSKKLGADYYSFHGGFCGYTFNLTAKKSIKPFSKKLASQYFITGLKKIIPYASRTGINIGFENNVVKKGEEKLFITCSIPEIKEIFQTIKSPRLFLHLDAGHLNVTARTFSFSQSEFIKQFREKIFAVHLNENNGLADQGLNFDKSLWLTPYLKSLTNLNYLIVETNGPLTKKYINNLSSTFLISSTSIGAGNTL